MSTHVKDGKKALKQKVDTYFLVILFIFFLLIFVLSFSLPEIAGIVPRLISGTGIILTLIKIATVRFQRRGQTGEERPTEESVSRVTRGIPWFCSLALAVAYLLAMIFLGFALSTILVLAFVPPLLGRRKWLSNIIFAAITTVILYIAFVNLFYVRLPLGLLFEKFM